MSVGFRKSIFGFNQEDVIEYIRKLHDSFSEKEKSLNSKADQLKDEIRQLQNQNRELEIQKSQAEEELGEYRLKTQEMRKLSENIGKLYLVARTNAESIMNNAQKDSAATREEIARNISAIDETHSALDELCRSVMATAENFTKEIEGLSQSLANTKEQISESVKDDEVSEENFSSLLNSLSK